MHPRSACGDHPSARHHEDMVPAAVARMLTARIAAVGIGLVTTVVVARILTPDDFGIFAVGMAWYVVAQAISQFGLIEDLVRRDQLRTVDLRAASGLAVTMVGASLLIAVIVLVLTSRIDDAPMLGLTAFFAAALMAQAMALPFEARRRHGIDFGLLSVLVVATAVADAAVAIALAAAGWGPVAMAAGIFAGRLTTLVVLVVADPSDELPWPGGTGAWRQFGRFGAGFMTARLAPRLGDLATVSLIGRGIGVAGLGVFNRIRAVTSIPDRTIFEAINPIILPALSRALRGEMTVARAYLHKVDYLVVTCWPIFAGMAVLADPIVDVLLGDQWGAAVTPIQIFALGGLFLPFTKMSMKLFIAIDRIDTHVKIQIVVAAVTVAAVAGTSNRSLEAVCAGLVVARAVEAVAVWRAVSSASVGDLRVPVGMLARGAVTVAATVAGPLALGWFVTSGPLLLVGGIVVGTAGWLVAITALRHRIVGDVRSLRSRPGTGPVDEGDGSIYVPASE